jgi:hypothetical protein
VAHLGSLQVAQADKALERAQLAYYGQTLASGRSTFGLSTDSKLGRALGDDPIATAVQTKTSTEAQQATSEYQSASQAAVATYKKLAKLDPSQDNLLALARTAQRYQDIPTAVKAYRDVMKTTDDPTLKADLRAQIKALQPAAAKGSGG